MAKTLEEVEELLKLQYRFKRYVITLPSASS